MIKDTFLVGISLKICLQHFEFYVFTNKRQKQNFLVGRNTSRVKSRLRCSMKPYWILTRQHQQLCFTVSSSVVNLESAPIWFSLVCAVFCCWRPVLEARDPISLTLKPNRIDDEQTDTGGQPPNANAHQVTTRYRQDLTAEMFPGVKSQVISTWFQPVWWFRPFWHWFLTTTHR